MVTHYAVHFDILPPFYPVRFASARLYFPNLSVLIAHYIELTSTPWLLYDACHTSLTHLLLMKFLPTMQNNWFCTKNPRRRNGLINYLHLAVISVLYRRNLLFFSFSPYPISHFASSFITAPSQLIKAYPWVSHSLTVSINILRPLHRCWLPGVLFQSVLYLPSQPWLFWLSMSPSGLWMAS